MNGLLVSVLRKIKSRKAAGLDEIPPEVWKTRDIDEILLWHCNAVYNQNPIDRWTKGCILPFPKKGDLGLTKNYRGITFISIVAKIYTQPHRIPNWEDTLEEPKCLSEKSIHGIINFDYPSNSCRCTCKKTYSQQYHLSTSPRPLTPYTEGRWSKYYSLTAYPKKQSQP